MTVLPEWEIRLELNFTGDRSSILGTRPVITLSGKLRAKNDKKNAPKITKKKLREDYVIFSRTFPYLFSYNF